MGYFVTYNRPLGNLLIGVSAEQPPFVNDDITTDYVEGEIPDLNKVAWSNGSCTFEVIPENTERHLSKFQFTKLLTPDQFGAIKTLAASNSQIGYIWEMFETAEYIDLDLAETQQALNLLESLGVLPTGRAAEILK